MGLVAGIPCPHARPTDGCVLPPGVRYCICHADQERDPVADVSVRDGQLYWSVRERIGATYVAVLPRADGFETVDLVGSVEFRVHRTGDLRRAVYRVRGRDARTYEFDAAELVNAGAEAREFVACAAVDP